MINVYKILKKTKVEGPGVRFCIWVQGCKKHCSGCFAKDTWSFGSGQDYTIDELVDFIESENGIEGVTFLGGEPFEQAQELSELALRVKQKGLSVLCFTGYTFDELKAKNDKYVNNLLGNLDLLIDGGFEIEKFDISRPWVGSSNQRYIFLTDFYKEEDIKSYRNKIEARISPDGKLEINGMGDFDKINKDFCLQLGKDVVK